MLTLSDSILSKGGGGRRAAPAAARGASGGGDGGAGGNDAARLLADVSASQFWVKFFGNVSTTLSGMCCGSLHIAVCRIKKSNFPSSGNASVMSMERCWEKPQIKSTKTFLEVSHAVCCLGLTQCFRVH